MTSNELLQWFADNLVSLCDVCLDRYAVRFVPFVRTGQHVESYAITCEPCAVGAGRSG